MGWLCEWSGEFHKPNGAVDRRRCLDKKFTWTSTDAEGNTKELKVLKSAMVGRVYYAAVAEERNGERKAVSAVICLTCGKSRRDGTEWGFKDMDETMGPYCYDCPKSILDLLTPTDNETANKWRAECRAKAERKTAERKMPPMPLYAPSGVSIIVRGRSWIVSSAEFRAATRYIGLKYSKARFHTPDSAVGSFLSRYGTAEQKAEFTASGRKFPEWTIVA